MRSLVLSSVFLMILLLSACTKDAANSQTTQPSSQETQASPAAPAATAAEASATGHASPDVKPGSHEDWCGEHQVPESMCTRCNASLVAAFKATGDWCEEHGLPETQCLKCNPNLKIVRPPKEN